MWSAHEAIEVFHLLFLRAIGAHADRALYALKGGCNLRFKFQKLLLDAGADRSPLPKEIASNLPRAIENAMSIGYDEFAGQVLAYLEPEYQDYYRARRV